MTHAHHFVLDTPSGPKTRGVCKECGEEREWLTGFYDLHELRKYKQASEASIARWNKPRRNR